MGFLGGVNFALLVTRVCLHYPHAPAAAIVRRFFKVLDSWPWSECLPFMVTGIDRGGPAMHLVWQPRLDRREVFPIITPCYPASNSTFNVSVRTALRLAFVITVTTLHVIVTARNPRRGAQPADLKGLSGSCAGSQSIC